MSKEYKVIISKSAEKSLSKMDSYTKRVIVSWLEEKLEQCNDPRQYGKSLTGDLSGKWRYRVGDYRIIAEIQDEKILILVLAIGHRREVYSGKIQI